MDAIIVLIFVAVLACCVWYIARNSDNSYEGITVEPVSISYEMVPFKVDVFLAAWKQFTKEMHTYNYEDESANNLDWWSKYAYEDNVAWPTSGTTTFNLGFYVKNDGDEPIVFGTSKNTLRLWVCNEYGDSITNGYVKPYGDKSNTDYTIAPGEKIVLFTDYMEIPTLEDRKTIKYNISCGYSKSYCKNVGSFILEGNK